jgi:hypothetical protein
MRLTVLFVVLVVGLFLFQTHCHFGDRYWAYPPHMFRFCYSPGAGGLAARLLFLTTPRFQRIDVRHWIAQTQPLPTCATSV